MKRVPATVLVAILAAGITTVVQPAASAGKPRPTCQGIPATIVGTTHDIQGTEGDDVIVVLATGNNNIHALGGDDLVCGGDGHDQLFDGPGRDRFYGGKGEDGLIQESVDRDFFDGGPGFDAVDYYWRTADMYINLRNRKADDGQAGEHDRLLSVGSVTTGFGNDVLIAGTEKDTDGHGFPSSQDYYLISGAGDDLLIGGHRGELMRPGAGRDVVRARAGRDYIDSCDEGPQGTGFAPEADVVDAGRDDKPDVVVHDELDVVTNASVTYPC